jgi:DNA mismatch repair protein MutS2
VLAQIGDSQNLELSLSSFSGSVLHLKGIVEAGGEQSLVLVDEILHATDPDEATALSRAILEELEKRGAYSIVTTHLNGLKVAGATGFESASMEFNPAEMLPTYRLRTGIPGSSRALEIALRLGLDETLVDRARSYLSEERIEEQKAVDRLEIRERELDAAKTEAQQMKELLENERSLHRLLNEELANVKKRFRGEAMERIRLQQQEAMSSLDAVISAYKAKLSSVQEKHEASLTSQGELESIRTQFQAVEKSLDEVAPAPVVEKVAAIDGAARFQRNGAVFVKSMQTEGVLLSDPEASGKLEVAVGTMRLRVSLEQLEPRASAQIKQNKYRHQEASECPPELKLIGLTVDEATDRLLSYLDIAARSGRPSVRIVHGHGSGALKKAVRKILADSDYEMKFRPGTAQEGGEGCTVVEFS